MGSQTLHVILFIKKNNKRIRFVKNNNNRKYKYNWSEASIITQ